MSQTKLYGYAGSMLRVDLSKGQMTAEKLDAATMRKYLGGTGLGAKYLYDEVPPGIDWSDPENRLIIAGGPLGGTRIPGSGTFSVVAKGALTNGGTSTQANGFLGAYLKFNGFDGIIIQGAAKKLSYLYIHDGVAELRDAAHLAGKDTWETEDIIKKELGKQDREMTVFGIGPAGENLVRFAMLCGDGGHTASHNGMGAVLGSKKLKAIAVARGNKKVPLKDEKAFNVVAREMRETLKTNPAYRDQYLWGTLHLIRILEKLSVVPIKNLTTNILPIKPEKWAKYSAEYIREHFEPRPTPCWACSMHHGHELTITEGPYAGMVVEEPEYEQLAAWGPAIGQGDIASTLMLAHEVDCLGMDTNESAWTIGLVMECYEKGILTREDCGGLEMTWGNTEAAREMLRRIATRQGLGNILAEGVKRSSQRIGGEAPNIGVYTMKGNSPRCGDHRSAWLELFDTCVSNTGTIETHRLVPRAQFGLPPVPTQFSPEETTVHVARTKGSMQFEDSLGVCRFTTKSDIAFLNRALKAATGWDLTIDEAMDIGRRAVNLLRAFNIRAGITSELDRPSPRYGSTPVDGPSQGKAIMPLWDKMLRDYYRLMGWDEESGKPLPETLKRLAISHVIPDIWGKKTGKAKEQSKD